MIGRDIQSISRQASVHEREEVIINTGQGHRQPILSIDVAASIRVRVCCRRKRYGGSWSILSIDHETPGRLFGLIFLGDGQRRRDRNGGCRLRRISAGSATRLIRPLDNETSLGLCRRSKRFLRKIGHRLSRRRWGYRVQRHAFTGAGRLVAVDLERAWSWGVGEYDLVRFTQGILIGARFIHARSSPFVAAQTERGEPIAVTSGFGVDPAFVVVELFLVARVYLGISPGSKSEPARRP